MSPRTTENGPAADAGRVQEGQEGQEEGHGGMHWLWMVLCCLPMIVIVVMILVGAWGFR